MLPSSVSNILQCDIDKLFKSMYYGPRCDGIKHPGLWRTDLQRIVVIVRRTRKKAEEEGEEEE